MTGIVWNGLPGCRGITDRDHVEYAQDRYTSEFQALIDDILTDLSGGE